MSLVEFLGFLISVAAVLFLFLRHMWEGTHRNPEHMRDEEQKQKQVLQDFLKSLDIELEDEKQGPPLKKIEPQKQILKPPPAKKPKRSVEDGFQYQARLDAYKQSTSSDKWGLKTSIEQEVRKFDERSVVSPDMQLKGKLKVAPGESRGSYAIRQLTNRKQMFIFQTLLNRPKGLL